MRGFSKVFLASFLSTLLFLAITVVGCAPAAQPESLPKLEPTPPGMINSALGPISPDELGWTLIHEHFCFAYPGWFADATIAPYDREAALEAGLKAVEAGQAGGVQNI